MTYLVVINHDYRGHCRMFLFLTSKISGALIPDHHKVKQGRVFQADHCYAGPGSKKATCLALIFQPP